MNLQNAAVLNDVLSKSQVNSTPASKQAEESKGGDSGQSFDPYCEFEIDKDLPGMDVVEEEKLEWMKHAVTTVQKDDKASSYHIFHHSKNNLCERSEEKRIRNTTPCLLLALLLLPQRVWFAQYVASSQRHASASLDT